MARRVRLNPSEARKFSEIINEAILDSPNAKRDLAKVRKELEQEFKVARATAKRLRDRKTYLKSEAEKNIRESRKLMQRAQKLDAADRETEADAAADKAADLQIKAQAMMGEFKTGSIQSKKLVDRLKEIQSDINRVDKLISALDAKEDRRRRGIPDPTSPGQERSKREKAQKAAFAELVIFYKDRVKPHVRKYPTAAGDVEFVEGQLPVIRRKLNRGDDVSFELRRVDKAVRDLHKLVKPRKTKRIFADVRRGLEAFVEETARLAKEGAPQKEVDQVLFELDEFSRSFSAKEKADFTMDERREMSRSIRKIQKALRMMKGRRKKNPCIGLHFHGKDADELLAAMEASAKRQKLEAKKNLPNPMHKVPKKATKAQVRSTVSKNIALLMEEGYPQKQAVAISLTRAREDAPGKVKSIYGPSPNPSTNPYLGDAVTKAKAKMAKKRGRPTPPPLPAKMKKKMSSRKVSNPKKNPKKNPRLTPAQKDRRDRIYRMMRQGYEPSFADQAFLEAIGSQHRVRREYADVEIEKPRKQKGKGRIRVSLEGSKRENPSKRPMINGWEVDTYMSGPPHQWAARISDPNSSGVHLTRTVNKFQFNLNVHTADIEQYGSFIQFELTSSDPRFYESETISARKYGLVLEAPKLQVIKLLKAATWWADKKIPKKHNPSKRSNSKPKAKKKTAKKTTRKAPLAKTLIAKCQKNWDHYCERPSKKRLKEVFDHLEVMKESSAKTVNEERARCLRAANKEAKRLKMKK